MCVCVRVCTYMCSACVHACVVHVCVLGMQQYYNISIIAIFITAIQYNTPDEEYRYIAHCDILQYIATFFALQVVRIQLLHCKND